METLGPNTNAPTDLLSSDCIPVAGEDRRHLLPLLDSNQVRGIPTHRLYSLPGQNDRMLLGMTAIVSEQVKRSG